MSHSHDKKGKKHHHHHKGVVPPKKSKNHKKDKKKDATKRDRSARKTGSKANLNKDPAYDTLLPSAGASDTNAAYFSEQPSNPTMGKKNDPKAHSPVTVPTTTVVPATSPAAPTPPPVLTVFTQAPAPAAVTLPKWKAEDVAMSYMKQLDAGMARQEYVDACAATQVNIDTDCSMWKKNLMKNQSDAYPVQDASLVKLANTPDGYVNMSTVTVPHCRYPILMAQMPKKGCEEEFWRAAFQENVIMMYILKGPDDDKCDFFPTGEGAFVYHGTMFVNNRKVEKMDEERTRYTMEILPNGFSNSILANIYVHTGWDALGVPVKYANTTRSVVDLMNFVKTSNGTDKLMIVSRNGCGRAGYFLSLGAAFCCLNDLSEPRIGEIVKSIRQQRPNSVESMKQYASLYLCLFYYIKKKMAIPEDMKQKVEDVTKAFENLIRQDLSIIY